MRHLPTLVRVLCALSLVIVSCRPVLASSLQPDGNDGISYLSASGELHFEGRIDTDFDRQLSAALSAHPRARTLVISSLGGNLQAALRASRPINDQAITVRATGRCASACAMLWAAASHRQIETHAQLGLHASRFSQPAPVALESVLADSVGERKTEILSRAGFPERIIDRALATPASRMYWLSPRQLRRAGIDCDVVGDGVPLA